MTANRRFTFVEILPKLAFLGWLLFMPAHVASAQEPTPIPTTSPVTSSDVPVEDDPTKPVLFSIRNEYRDLRFGAWANTVILRYDRLSFLNLKNNGGARGLILRFDLPINTVHRGQETKSGLGDIYAQAIYLPHVRRKFVLATGAGVILPTATDRSLGQGKLILAPAVAPVWYFARRNRLFLIKCQNFFSVAGKSSRRDVNYLVAQPIIVHRLNRKWWITGDTEFRWDWKNKKGSGITGLQVGRMMRGKYGFWLKPELPWGPGRTSDFHLKFTVFRIR